MSLNHLPPIQKISVRHEADYYGFSLMVARRLGRSSIPMPCTATWSHGWRPFEFVKYPEQLALWGGPDSSHVVQTKAHAEFLKAEGYKHVQAVGAPLLYTHPALVQRQPSSLLVTPVHTLSHIGFKTDFHLFFENVAALKRDFKTICVCLHQESVTPEILEILRKFEFPYVLGASAHDAFSLYRIRSIFHQFESMVTNHMGSHVLYFNHCGGKTSIMEPYFEFSKSDFLKHEWYQNHPRALEQVLLQTKDNLRTIYPFLFEDIRIQKVHKEWADQELGLSEVKAFSELPAILGWTLASRIRRFRTHPRLVAKSLLAQYDIHVEPELRWTPDAAEPPSTVTIAHAQTLG